MTPSEVLTYLRSQSAEDSTSFWGDTELYTHMTHAEYQIVQTIGTTIDSTSCVTTGDGTREYTIPSDVGRIHRLTWDTVRMQEIDINQLDDVEGTAYGGIDTTGNPEYYYRYGINTIGFSPIPDQTASVVIYHEQLPTTITGSSTSFTVPDRYTHYIPDYVLWQMFAKDQQLQEMALMYAQKWQADLKLIQYDWMQTRYADRYPTVVAQDPIFVD